MKIMRKPSFGTATTTSKKTPKQVLDEAQTALIKFNKKYHYVDIGLLNKFHDAELRVKLGEGAYQSVKKRNLILNQNM